MDLRRHGEIEIALFHGLDHSLIGQFRRFDLNKAPKRITHGICQRKTIMIVIRGHGEKLLTTPEHLIIALGIETIEAVMFAAVIVDLHCPESLKILIVIIILQGPVGMIVTAQKTCVCPLLYVSVLSGHILISISRKRELFSHLRLLIVEIQMITFGMRPAAALLRILGNIHLDTCKCDESFIRQFRMIAIGPVVCERHDGITPFPVLFPDLLLGQFSIGNHRMTMQVRLVKLSLSRKKIIILHLFTLHTLR